MPSSEFETPVLYRSTSCNIWDLQSRLYIVYIRGTGLPICIFADIADTDIFFADMSADIFDIVFPIWVFLYLLSQKSMVIFDDFAELYPNSKHPNKHSNSDLNTKFCIGYQNPQIWGNL